MEMTDGTHEYNCAYREGVGFYYDLVKANVERILIGLTAELRERVRLNADQTPQYSNIQKAGHELGGDFVFARR